MTIGRNRRKLIASLFENATNFRCLSLSNNFMGVEVPRDWVEKEFNTYTDAKLVCNVPGTFTLRIHSNLWYEFQSSVEVAGVSGSWNIR